MAKINIEFDGKLYSVDESTLASLASPLEQALIKQLAGTGAVIRFGGTNYNVDANKLASARNVLTGHFSAVAGTDSKVTVNGAEYGLSKAKLQGATNKVHETLGGISEPVLEPGLYETGSNYSVKLKTWNELLEQQAFVVRDNTLRSGVIAPANLELPEKNEYGFYFDVQYGTDRDSVTFYADGRVYYNNQDEGSSWETASYYPNEAKVSRSSITFSEDGLAAFGDFYFGWDTLLIEHCSWTSYEEVGDLVLPADGTITAIEDLCHNRRDRGTNYTLTGVIIPDSVTTIGECAFSHCFGLTHITIPDSVLTIGIDAFYGCENLRAVTIGKNVKTIEAEAFMGTGIQNIVIPNSVTTIKSSAFMGCNMMYIIIPDSVTDIDSGAFGWSSLQYAIIGSGIVNMGPCFNSCYSLKDIYINKPEGSVTGADWCSGANPTVHWNSTGPEEEPTDPEEPVEPALPASEGLVFKLNDYSQSYAVASIGTCTDTDVVIPDTHEGLPVTSIDKEAFKGCTSLTSVTIPNSVTSISSGAFWNCDGFTSVTIPDSVTNICDFAFRYCESLTSVTIGNGVTSIGDYAFSGCTSLTDIYINKSEGSMSYLGDWWSSGATIHWNSTGPEN